MYKIKNCISVYYYFNKKYFVYEKSNVPSEHLTNGNVCGLHTLPRVPMKYVFEKVYKLWL